METQTTTGIQHGKVIISRLNRGGEVIMNSNNNITLTLTGSINCQKIGIYVSKWCRQQWYDYKMHIYYKTSAENAEIQENYRKIHIIRFRAPLQESKSNDRISECK